MKFNKKHIYIIDCGGGKIYYNYLDGNFTYTNWYVNKNDKDMQIQFIKEVKLELKIHNQHKYKNIKIIKTDKANREETTVDLSTALKSLSGYVLDINYTKERLLDNYIEQTFFYFFKVINGEKNEKI